MRKQNELMAWCLVGLMFMTGCGATLPIENLYDLYKQERYDEVITASQQLLEQNPNNADILGLLGQSLAGTGKCAEAIPYLERVTRNNVGGWREAWALYYLGRCYYREGDRQQAQRYLEQCQAMNATKKVTQAAQKFSRIMGLDDFYATWNVQETEHCMFYFAPPITDAAITTFVTSREKAFEEIDTFFHAALPKKITFYIWDSAESAQAAGLPPLGFAQPESLVIHSRLNQSPGHELTHVIAHYSGTARNTTTRFIEEGIAVCFDQTGSHLERAKRVFADPSQFTGIIQKLWEHGGEYDEAILYSIAGAFVEYIIQEYGREQFLILLTNQTYEHASIVYGDALHDIIANFENALRE